jgi:integrase
MGTVYRKTFTKPLPAGAEIIVRKGERLARCKDAKGKARTAPMVGTDAAEPNRIIVSAGTYTAKYRDGNGIVIECSTGCRDQDAARRVLAEMERRAELVKAGVVTAAESAVAHHQSTPLSVHLAAYLDHLHAKGASKMHRDNVRRQLERLAAECSFSKLADLGRDALEKWLAAQAKADMGARTRNTYLAAGTAFCNWCIETRRLNFNPFASVARADERADCRRQRRALTEAELVRLLDVAQRRPLVEAMTVRRGKRKGQLAANIRDDVRRQLELLGRERALIYKTLVLTGLRRGELASLTVGQLELDGPLPCIVLDAADEKNRAGSTLPLRSDLAADLALWVKELAQRHSGDSGEFEGPLCLPMTTVPAETGLPADAPLFNVPSGLIRILDRDLTLADIPKRDDRGRTIDVHAMRTSFCTMLAKGGVAPRTAMAAARHSDIALTMTVYTDPRALDIHAALDVLPALPLDGTDRQEQRATGTDGRLHQLAPTLALKTGQRGKAGATADKMAGERRDRTAPATDAVNPWNVKENNPLTTAVNGLRDERAKGLEPSTSSLGS